mmetsp:Transcript_24181/g.61227  ORF Transcript_24181/g.61227 Transcript_24181/m.61227 type:complete len:262 (-) Transcript_24181:472-1257(-)
MSVEALIAAMSASSFFTSTLKPSSALYDTSTPVSNSNMGDARICSAKASLFSRKAAICSDRRLPCASAACLMAFRTVGAAFLAPDHCSAYPSSLARLPAATSALMTPSFSRKLIVSTNCSNCRSISSALVRMSRSAFFTLYSSCRLSPPSALSACPSVSVSVRVSSSFSLMAREAARSMALSASSTPAPLPSASTGRWRTRCNSSPSEPGRSSSREPSTKAVCRPLASSFGISAAYSCVQNPLPSSCHSSSSAAPSGETPP